ncbi:MAG: hypothetical protein M1825_005005 [Sarcosagium campestre]|nr:MAG: hypothetical protein M1825_005005 [Sarcosagium campestre]
MPFVVDGTWTTDHTAPQEPDGLNNVNNFLTPADMSKPDGAAAFGAAATSSAAPNSTTAKLAQDVPIEAKKDGDHSGMPGFFPETPSGEQTEFSVKPLPATAGPANPVQLKPGEKIPDSDTVTAATTTSHVTLDKESYDKAGSGSMGPPALPPVVTPQVERNEKGVGAFDVPGITDRTIPESSLPIGDSSTAETKDSGPFIQSAAPTSTTAALAAAVPFEKQQETPDVPKVVQESQAKAHVGPEASGSAEAVHEKEELEKQLKKQVPEIPPTAEGTAHEDGAGTTDKSEDTSTAGKIVGAATGGVAAAGATAVAYATGSKSKEAGEQGTTAGNSPGGVADSVMQSIKSINKSSDDKYAAGVPEVAKESIAESHQSPEAATNAEAVEEKAAVERELLHDIKPVQSSGEPAPSASAALTDKAPGPTGASDGGLAASAAPPASTPATKDTTTSEPIDSRDISPMTKDPDSQPQPLVTSGPQESKTDAASTPEKSTATTTEPSSPVEGSSKKEKRRSAFFGKLKEKWRR